MSNTERAMMLSQGQQKITLQHQERLACIYIRQSSPGQVRHNKESQVNQYQLGQRAELLGWSQERISVIDCDLGLSGKDSVSRESLATRSRGLHATTLTGIIYLIQRPSLEH